MRVTKLLIIILVLSAAGNGVMGYAMEKYRDPRPLAADEFAGSVMLAAMRPVVKSYLWCRADTLIRDRKYFEVKPILDRLAEIEPHFTEAYFYNAAILAFDMPAMAKSLDVKWRWVSEGFRYAARGAEINPDEPALSWLAAWILYRKIAVNRWHGKEFETFFMKDLKANPDGEHPLDVIIRYAERARALPDHDPSTENLLDKAYSRIAGDAKKLGDIVTAVSITEQRQKVWTEFEPPSDRSGARWREKKANALSEIERELGELRGGPGGK
ncbi:MAG: hypothetical protein ACYS8W_15510 [Planctomycetota bacterium]